MIDKVVKTILDFDMLAHGEKVVCAFSGGADSCCLIDVLQCVADRLDITVAAAHLNHMLRGEESYRDEEFVGKLCEKRNIELYSERVDINSIARKTKKSVELAARDERYKFYTRAKSSLNANKIATAHNADDSLETVLFNLSRGTGLKGLCGIPAVRNDIIRPLIYINKEEILNYLKSKNLAYVEDSSNKEHEYARNKIRHLIIPVLKSINPNTQMNSLRMMDVLRKEENYLQEQVEIYLSEYKFENNSIIYPISILNSIHPAIRRRLIVRLAGKLFNEQKNRLEFDHICDIIQLAQNKSPSVKLSLPNKLVVRRDYDRLIFEKAVSHEKAEPFSVELRENHEVVFGNYRIFLRKTKENEEVNNSLNTFFIACDKIDKILIVRKRWAGDKIKLIGRPEKTLKKLLIEHKISKDKRDYIPVLADTRRVIAVYGFGVDERIAAQGSEPAYCVTVTKNT